MRRYLTFYVIYEDVACEEPYIEKMEKALSGISGKIIRIRGRRDDFGTVFSKINDNLNSVDDTERVVILTSDLFGPFTPLEPIFDKMREKRVDIWSLFLPMGDKDEIYSLKINTDFCVIEDWRKSKSDMGEFAGSFHGDGMDSERFAFVLSEFLQTKNYVFGSYCTMPKERLQSRFPLQEDIHLPYTMINRYGYPFLNKKCFEQIDMLHYSLHHELRRALDYIRTLDGNSSDIIWEYLLRTYNIYDIKKLLHLEYVISSEYRKRRENREMDYRVAVFCHLFYEDLLEESLCYLKHIPKGVHIYISTPEKNIDIYRDKFAENGIANCTVLEAGVRGRDAGALLVTFREYVKQYDYICFLHDKKTSGGIAPIAEGKAFMDLVWDNLLASEEYFFNVLDLLEQNPRLGVLTPPIPLMGTYTKYLLGNEWTVCYEETQKLADRLKLDLKLDETKPVFSLSTTFWCRTKALAPLWEYSWEYESFPEEPLALDGTLNHAIERILIYIAQSQGYYSAVVSNEEYASVYLNDLMYMVDNIFTELHSSNVVDLKFPIKFSELITSMKSLYKFCLQHSSIIVYGAGAQAKRMEKTLSMLDVDFGYFVVSQKEAGMDTLNGHVIKEFAEIQNSLDKNCGIILAMSVKFQSEVIPMISESGVDYYCIDAE